MKKFRFSGTLYWSFPETELVDETVAARDKNQAIDRFLDKQFGYDYGALEIDISHLNIEEIDIETKEEQ